MAKKPEAEPIVPPVTPAPVAPTPGETPAPAAVKPDEVKPPAKTAEELAKEQIQSEIAGLESQKGAVLKDVEVLRLEKRTLSEPSQPAVPIPALPVAPKPEEEELDEFGNPKPRSIASDDKAVKEAIAPLEKRLDDMQASIKLGAIEKFSADPNYPLTNKATDAGNANWKKMEAFYVARHGTGSQEAYLADMADAYRQAFHEDIVKQATERARLEGAAEALKAGAAGTGAAPGGGEPPKQPVILTEAQKREAKKLGITEEKYIEGLKGSGRLPAD